VRIPLCQAEEEQNYSHKIRLQMETERNKSMLRQKIETKTNVETEVTDFAKSERKKNSIVTISIGKGDLTKRSVDEVTLEEKSVDAKAVDELPTPDHFSGLDHSAQINESSVFESPIQSRAKSPVIALG